LNSAFGARPKTAGAPELSKLNEVDEDDDEFDKELNALIARNQKQLADLHSEVKDISKITGEATVQIRKLKGSVLKENKGKVVRIKSVAIDEDA